MRTNITDFSKNPSVIIQHEFEPKSQSQKSGGICYYCRTYQESADMRKGDNLVCDNCANEMWGVSKKKKKFKLVETPIRNLLNDMIPHSKRDALLCPIFYFYVTFYRFMYIPALITGIIDFRFKGCR